MFLYVKVFITFLYYYQANIKQIKNKNKCSVIGTGSIDGASIYRTNNIIIFNLKNELWWALY